ncbi:MAG: D-ala-D-ala transporter subunit [Deltaproteobacteria bacterium SM23_61]|jgi:peptide/nickel transport system permease protein|nr:MAG: D-ala-D-ala transporter subunit [Deltaproteobacteria bacterium SM23_61]
MTGFRLTWKKITRDRLAFTGFLIILSLVAAALFAGILAPYPEDTFRIHPAKRLSPPSPEHLLGTDSMGRDILSRLLFGARVTLVISIIAVGASLLVGAPLGLLAGYFETWISELIMRVADIFLSIPQVILAIFLAQSFRPSIRSVILALSITYWPWFTRIVYAEARSLKKTAFIESTEALGAGRIRTMLLHVLPNVSSSIIVRSSIGMGFTILTAATLGFLGVGAQPPTPEWGVTIAESRQYLPDAWWYATFPGLAIFIVVMGFNMLGDGLRDILDPRIRRGFD